VKEIHLLARGGIANDDVIMIRVELLTIHIWALVLLTIVLAIVRVNTSTLVHDIGHITSQVVAVWRNTVVVIVTQPDRVPVGARDAGAATGVNSALALEALQVIPLLLIE
jgi:hypothetical protein